MPVPGVGQKEKALRDPQRLRRDPGPFVRRDESISAFKASIFAKIS